MVAPRNRKGHYTWKYAYKPKKISAIKAIKRTFRLAQTGLGKNKKKRIKKK